MRDFEPLRRRILAAMGIYGVSVVMPACEGKTEAKAAVQTDGGTTGQIADGGGTTGDGGGTGTADVPAKPETNAPTDNGPSVDAAADPGGTTGVDTAIADTSPPDVAPQDVPEPLDAGAPDIAATDAGEDTADAGLCSFGKPEYACYTAANLKAMIENPPMGGDAPKPVYTGPLPPAGCPERELVLDGCCNAAVTPGVIEGDTCCYYHCTGACCGRPLEVAGEARVAPLVPSAAWLDRSVASVATTLTPKHARALAQTWRADAQDEHAAIASFMRFGLDLLALGAPPELVLDTARATADEVAHARACFGIAERLDGAEMGPGKLDCTGVAAHGSLRDAAVAAAREGCVGETLAAICASAGVQHVTDLELAATLSRIAADEARHAELAWRFVAWAVRTGGPTVRQAVAEVFAQTLAAGPAPDTREALLVGVPDDLRIQWGRLPAGESVRLRRRALDGVIAPCVAELMGHPDRATPALLAHV